MISYLKWLLTWATLAAVCGIGFLHALINGLIGNYERADRTFRCMSRLTAAVVGYSGYYSLSAESGSRRNRMAAFIDWLLGEGHCAEAVRVEKLGLKD